MKELLKIFFVLFFISLITFSTISVFAEDLNNSNQTNVTNSTNSTNKTVTKNAIVQPMSVLISLDVSPDTINFGGLPADGREYPYSGVTTVDVSATEILWDTGSLTVKANDFTRGTDTTRTILVNNLKYDCSGDVSLNKRSFTKNDVTIDTYPGALWRTYQGTYNLHYYLTVPVGTDPGNYNTTIFYTVY